MPKAHLPHELTAGPFALATGRAHGLSDKRMRGDDLISPVRGVRAVAEPMTPVDRAACLAVVLPEQHAFSHATAVLLHELPGVFGTFSAPGLHVMFRTDVGRVRRPGCRGHRGLEIRSTTTVQGLCVVDLADTWVDLGELARPRLTLDEYIIIGDAIAARLGSTRPLVEALGRRVRPRGKRTMVTALAEIRVGVKSPMETKTRLMLTRAAFPDPEINAPVYDNDGGWILEGDLVWREQKVVVEYQGEVHAPIEQRSKDNQRRLLAEANGWTFIEVFKEDLAKESRRRALLARLRIHLGFSFDAPTTARRVGTRRPA